MKTTIQSLAIIFSSIILLISCLSDDTDTEVLLYNDTAITQFSLGTLNRYLTTKATSSFDEEGNPVDSIYKVEIDGKIVTRPYLEGTTFGNYIRLVHYADQAIGELFDRLDAAGLLDDTVVIIYGDHDARLDKKYYNILYNYDPIKDTMKKEGDPGYVKIDDLRYNLDKKVPFIIWSKDTNFNLEIEKPMGMIDVLPTLGNMFNFKSPYQLGNDIFSTEDNMVVFPDGNYLTSKYYYDSQKELTYSLKGDPIDKNYIEKRRQESSDIVEISNYITTYDLIKNIRIKNEQNKK